MDGESLLWADTTRPRRGPKPAMTLQGVVDAAIAVADAEGLAAVSMQRVADELGATKMALYRYVPGKAELNTLMLDRALGAPSEPAAPSGAGEGSPDWPALLADWARELYRRFVERPWGLELAVGARIIGPNELAWFEVGLAALSGVPLTAAERLDVLALLSGHVRSVVQQQERDVAPEQSMGAMMARIVADHADTFPYTADAFAESAADPGQDQALEFGLERILDGVAALTASRSTDTTG